MRVRSATTRRNCSSRRVTRSRCASHTSMLRAPAIQKPKPVPLVQIRQHLELNRSSNIVAGSERGACRYPKTKLPDGLRLV